MKRIISIILIFCHVTLLFAQNPPPPSSKFREIIYFKPGGGISISKSNVEITGELISIKLKQKLNPETGFTSEVVFKPFEKSLISPSVVGGTLNNGEYYIFDVNDILKIESRYLVGGYTLKTLFSDKVQNDYSNREEINDILNKEYDEFHQKRERKDEEYSPNFFILVSKTFDAFDGTNDGSYYFNSADQEIEFKKWGKFPGRLYSIRLNKELNPDTGLKSEIVFKVFENTKKLPAEDPFFVKGAKYVGKSSYSGGHPILMALARLGDSGNAYIFDPKDIRSIHQKTNYLHHDHDLILYNQDFQNEYKYREDVVDILNHEEDVFNHQIRERIDRVHTLSGIFLTGTCIVIAVWLLIVSGCGSNC